MSVVSMVVGAATPSGATFVAKVDSGPVRIAVSTSDDMSAPVFFGPESVDSDGVAKVVATGLDPDSRYWWQVEDDGVLDTSVTGTFRTHPPLGSHASFTVALASCAGLSPEFPAEVGGELDAERVSNHPVHETIRAADPLMFVHMGDWGYPDFGTRNVDTVTNRRRFFDDNLAQPNQAALFRDVAWAYIWDDHDFGPNDSDGTYPDKANAAQVYRERVPHYDLDDAAGIWQSWQIGRVLFVALDCRYYRDPNSDPDEPGKTMLGAAQLAWLDDLLATSDAEALVLISPSVWVAPPGGRADSWGSFQHEQAQLVGMLDQHGWLARMCVVYGDRHALGVDSGAGNPHGGFPVLQAASLDASFGEAVAGWYDVLDDTPGRDQYGTVEVDDHGSLIIIKLSGWRGTTELGSHTFGIPVGSAAPLPVAALADVLTGSHRATFEARIVTAFQTGDDPDGVEIPILGGDVSFDATADVFATVELTTEGHDGARSLFPRAAGDLLAPYGNEIWVRRGVDTGGDEPLWFSLGYFRIDSAEQSGDSSRPIRLSGSDRMAGIVDSRLVEPRQFGCDRTVGSVVSELVHEVYPDAVIVFDDDSSHERVACDLVVEEDRHQALLDIAESLGKVVYWDGAGVLRIEDPPDPEEIAWEIRAGRAGVVVDSGRAVSRQGMANGVVARGEGAIEGPVQAIVVDIGPLSPTRWGGRFGRVPHFFSSPLLTTTLRANAAATSLLGRRIGMPYSVNWGSVVNPALRPRQAVRVTQKSGDRERHIVETLTIPLVAGQPMRGTTREQTLVAVGPP